MSNDNKSENTPKLSRKSDKPAGANEHRRGVTNDLGDTEKPKPGWTQQSVNGKTENEIPKLEEIVEEKEKEKPKLDEIEAKNSSPKI